VAAEADAMLQDVGVHLNGLVEAADAAGADAQVRACACMCAFECVLTAKWVCT